MKLYLIYISIYTKNCYIPIYHFWLTFILFFFIKLIGVPKNLEQELESSKRVLQLTLTDGVQEIEAIEYKTIKCLNLNLSPGKKIRLMGPIQIRRGRVMLEERHIKVIGGEVDALLVENAAENILAKNLNQPLNPKPESIQENIQIENNSSNETGKV